MSSLSSLPGEIQVDIFLRLPLKSILTCKCVCKVWCSIVTSPIFVKDHLNLSIQTNNPRLLFIDHKVPLMYSIDCVTGAAMRMDCPFEYKGHKYVHFCGSCNGLICLAIINYTIITDKDANYFIIWNPTTREHKDVTPLRDFSSAFGKYGFGYDCKIDDYKLVFLDKRSGCLQILVYTLGSDSWNTIETNVYYSHSAGNTSGVLVNGVLHWFGGMLNTTQNTFSEVIEAFGITDQKLTYVPLPEESTSLARGVFKSVGMLEDCLCLVVSILHVRTDVWVMQNYGVRESWTKKITTSQSVITKSCYPKLIWVRNDGEVVIKTSDHLYLFNPTNRRVRKAYLHDIGEVVVVNVENYVESIVSPKGTSKFQKKTT